MSKKILGICAALVALAALAIPASASAATTLAETSGAGTYTPLAPGAKITATQDGESIFEAGGSTVKCTENKMTGEVHVNSDTEGITGTITAVSFQGSRPETKCESGLLGDTKVDIPAVEAGGHWCIKNVPGFDEFEFFGRGCTESGNGTLTFILTGSSLTCTYTRSTSVSGTFTTTEADPKAATLSASEPSFTEEGGKLLCPDSGTIKQMRFYLYTENPEETPAYIIDTP